MVYGILLGIFGLVAVLLSSFVMFSDLCNNKFSMKRGMPYMFGRGFFLLGLSNIIASDPKIKTEYFYTTCIASNQYITFEGTTKEEVCIKATIEYKRFMKYD